jgi:hypothetical protein
MQIHSTQIPGTATLNFNGILRHGVKHPDFILESKNYARERMSFLDSVQRRDERLYTCYKNRLLFRIYHYSSEKYDDVKEKMKPGGKHPIRIKRIKKAYGREVHIFRTRYEIHIDYKNGTKIYRIPLQDIFLAPSHFHLKRNQRSKSWPLNEKSRDEFKNLYEMIKEDGWYYKESRSEIMTLLGY